MEAKSGSIIEVREQRNDFGYELFKSTDIQPIQFDPRICEEELMKIQTGEHTVTVLSTHFIYEVSDDINNTVKKIDILNL